MENRFVIITMQRSGSNMLTNMLDRHPEIRCYGELMRKTPRWVKRDRYRGALRVLEKVDARFKKDSTRFANPETFLEEVYALSPGFNLYGFKIHVRQHPKLVKKLIRDPRYRIVILRRHNILAQYSSDRIAKVTGQGSARKGKEVKRATVDFKRGQFALYKHRVERHYEWVYKQLRRSGRPYFEIGYTELNNPGRVQALVEWLGADPSPELEPRTEKRNPSNILERFNNPHTAEKAVTRLGHGDWTYEHPR